MPSFGADTEQFRAAAEARFWNSVTKGNRAEVDALMERIAKKRGQPAADRLRELMRVEWRKGR